MGEKAVVTDISYLVHQGNGNYDLTCTAQVTNGNAHVSVTFTVTSTSFTPLTPTWRTLIKEGAIAQALADHSLTVDGVMFPDFGVLGL